MTDVTNILSFDLEHWHSATLLSEHVPEPVNHVRRSTKIVLDILDEHDVRATFFVVGRLAAEYPGIIRRIVADGHEIASHGHTHTPLFDLDPKSFQRELRRSVSVIEEKVDTTVMGFRAPNFSVTRETDWAFDILRNEGFRYDSSVFPVKTPMYGVSGAPIAPYRPSDTNPFEKTENSHAYSSLIELPLAVAHPKIRLPIGGGFYARILPDVLLQGGIRSLNRRGIPATIYFHPWEFNPSVRIDHVPLHKRFVSFYGIEKTTATLESLLTTFTFDAAKYVLPTEHDVIRRVA